MIIITKFLKKDSNMMCQLKKNNTAKTIFAIIIFILFLPAFVVCDQSYPTSSYSNAVAVSGLWAYAADGSAGVKIINLNEETFETYNSDDFGYVYDVAIDDNLLYVAAEHGIFIMDIMNRTMPSLEGWYETDGIAKAVALSNNHAYVADYAYGFQVIDVSDPANPVQKWLDWQSVDIGDIWNLTVGDDGYLYVANVGNGFSVWDISDPSAPVPSGSGYNTEGYTLDIEVKNGTAYVADGWNGILTFDISTITPRLENELATNGYGYGVFVTETYLCFSEGEAGLSLFDITSQQYPDSNNEVFHYDGGRRSS